MRDRRGITCVVEKQQQKWYRKIEPSDPLEIGPPNTYGL